MIVRDIYCSFKTSGMHTADHMSRAMNSANITAAEPKSLALLERSWCSKEIRSIAASTLELSNSTTKTMMSDDTKSAFSRWPMGRKKATGVSKANRLNSCLKALSSIKAYTRPHQEFLAACQALVNPRLPLWGFWSMWYLVFKQIFLRPEQWHGLQSRVLAWDDAKIAQKQLAKKISQHAHEQLRVESLMQQCKLPADPHS